MEKWSNKYLEKWTFALVQTHRSQKNRGFIFNVCSAPSLPTAFSHYRGDWSEAFRKLCKIADINFSPLHVPPWHAPDHFACIGFTSGMFLLQIKHAYTLKLQTESLSTTGQVGGVNRGHDSGNTTRMGRNGQSQWRGDCGEGWEGCAVARHTTTQEGSRGRMAGLGPKWKKNATKDHTKTCRSSHACIMGDVMADRQVKD